MSLYCRYYSFHSFHQWIIYKVTPGCEERPCTYCFSSHSHYSHNPTTRMHLFVRPSRVTSLWRVDMHRNCILHCGRFSIPLEILRRLRKVQTWKKWTKNNDLRWSNIENKKVLFGWSDWKRWGWTMLTKRARGQGASYHTLLMNLPLRLLLSFKSRTAK